MNLLPSEREARRAQALAQLEKTGNLVIHEPCNCGGRIRHNNGGNYHEIISLRLEDNKHYVQFDSTCELTPPAEWEEIASTRAEEIIARHADWL